MNFLPTLYLSCLVFTFIKSAPTGNKLTLYDAIVEKCPSLKSLPKFQEQPHFRLCNDWQRISQVQKLENSTKIDVLCLLYYNSFTEYCSNTLEVNTNLSTNLNIELEKICDNLDIIPNKTELDIALRKIIATKDHCKELCNDGLGYPVEICCISYQYKYLLNESVAKAGIHHLLKVPKVEQLKAPEKEENVQQGVNPQSVQQSDGDNQRSKNTIKNNSEMKSNNVPQNTNTQDQISAETPQNLQDKSLSNGIITVTPEDNNNNINSATNNNAQKSPQSEAKFKVNSPKDNENIEKENIEVTSDKKNPNAHDQTENQKISAAIPTLKDYGTDPNLSQDIQPPNNDQDKNIDGNDINHVPDVPENMESEEEEQSPQGQLNEKPPKPMQIDETEAVNFTTEMDGDSYFFTYFMLLCVIFIVGYICYHNKQKLLALILEGRRGKRQYRGRRPNSSNYHKLDSNLEEAITSSCNKNTNNVIY